jgi:hypothetical protein
MSGWESLGTVLGGGTDRAGAFEEGRLRTAQTENALAQARVHQLKAIADETKITANAKMGTLLAKHGVENPELIAGVMNAGQGDYAGTMQGELRRQELGNRGVLADPTADPMNRFLAGQGVQGKALSMVEAIGPGGYTDLTTGAPNVQLTPLGDSMVAENEATIGATGALENLRNVQAGDPDYQTVSGTGTGHGGGRAPSGYEPNPDFDPTRPAGVDNPKLRHIAGGPNDPDAPLRLGVNALAQFARVLNAAGNTALDLGNIVSMPSGATTGYFGQAGTGLLEAVPGKLANMVSPEEVQQYRGIVGTLGEQLATIERMGMRGSQGLSQRFDSLALEPTDTVATKMLKLAQMRQTVENGMETMLALNALNSDMSARARYLIGQVKTAIPFTPQDVLALRQAKSPTATLRSVMDAQRGSAPVAPGPTPAVSAPPTAPAPSGNIPTFATEAEAEAAGLTPGTRVIIGGEPGTWN